MQHMFIVGSRFILEAAGLTGSNMHLVLPHLYKDPVYLESYRALSKRGHILLQDNSIFELKDIVAGDLVDFGKQIGADYIMVPEVLRDADACIDAKDNFFSKLGPEGSQFRYAAAVQGKNYEEIARHYKNLSEDSRISLIAIPFNFEFDAVGGASEYSRQLGLNRFSIISRLFCEGKWNVGKQHHLLGLFNPAELRMYKSLPSAFKKSVMSNDSSSCYWHSVYGAAMHYPEGLLYRKIETHVDFNVEMTDPRKDVFIHNVSVLNTFIREGWSDL